MARPPGTQLGLGHLFHKRLLPVLILSSAIRSDNGPPPCSAIFPAARRFPRTCSHATLSARWLHAAPPAVPRGSASPPAPPGFRPRPFQTSAATPIPGSADATASAGGLARGCGSCARNNAALSPVVPPFAAM